MGGDHLKKQKNNKMTQFDYKKWITENKHGKNLYEQGTADFVENSPADYLTEQTGSNTGSGNPSTGSGYYCNQGTCAPNFQGQPSTVYSTLSACQAVCASTGSGGGTGSACVTPTSLSTSNIAVNSATLNWTGTSTATSYYIVYREQGVTSFNATVPSGNSSNINLNGLMAATTYEWGVYSICGQATSQMSTGNSGYTVNYSNGSFTPELFTTTMPSTGSAGWWCTGTGTAGPSCIQSSTIPSGTTSGPHPDQATCQTACTTQPTGSGGGCDFTPNGN